MHSEGESREENGERESWSKNEKFNSPVEDAVI
jgi:hypothetical protein